MPIFNLVRRGAYHDSVTLMRLHHEMEVVPDVTRAAAMMGTPANRALLLDAGLLGPEGDAAGPSDLIIAVIATHEAAARAAWQAAETALALHDAGPQALTRRPRTLASARAALPEANLALISVPGLYAAAEATRALHAGLHVMLFSDNVPVAEEVRLKRLARERDLFVMGPDCGTAIIGGVPLGFANAVPRGRIGLAAASGTGLQTVTCHLATAGEGVSHAIGLGGRDLSDEVGGLMLERALDALARDEATAVVCVIGKPPGPVTAKKIRGWLDRLGKPWVAHFTGTTRATDFADPWASSVSLEDAALATVARARGVTPQPVEFTVGDAEVTRLVRDAAGALAPGRRFVRGAYSGGTLAQEAAALLGARLGKVTTDAGPAGHRLVDLGDDRYTVGRPHPMIDGTVRREWILRQADDSGTAVILLDIVLGYGAHPDPVGEVSAALHAARSRGIAVVASVCGTEADPQGLAAQTDALRGAGAIVMPSNAQAARLAARIAERAGEASA